MRSPITLAFDALMSLPPRDRLAILAWLCARCGDHHAGQCRCAR